MGASETKNKRSKNSSNDKLSRRSKKEEKMCAPLTKCNPISSQRNSIRLHLKSIGWFLLLLLHNCISSKFISIMRSLRSNVCFSFLINDLTLVHYILPHTFKLRPKPQTIIKCNKYQFHTFLLFALIGSITIKMKWQQ